MSQDVMQGNWPRLRAEARQFFAELTDGDAAAIDRNPEMIVGVLQRRYGYTRAEALAALDRFMSANSYLLDA